MTTYALEFEFDSTGLKTLSDSKQQVCIVKSVGGQPGNIVWVSFKPFLNNKVTWQEIYGLYASSTQIQNGATISRLSTVKSIQKTKQYPFNQAGYFDPANSTRVTDYGLVNQYGETLTFGLTQVAEVNGKLVDSELNAVTVPNGNTAEFTPIVTLSIYTAAQLNNGSVISNISSNALVLEYSSETSQKVKYDSVSNIFVKA
eukprot:gene3198-4004_t